MYQPQKYKNNTSPFIYAFIQKYPFATIVLQGEKLLGTHVPVLVENNENGFRLFAHIANHNSMLPYIQDRKEMLLIFKGPDAYVSSSWYAAPDIPTWDYAAVHINARIKIQSDIELCDSLQKLILHFESNSQNPLRPEDIPKDIWDENFREITGFWLEPLECLGIEKLHQGFNPTDITRITEKLRIMGSCPMSQLADQIHRKHNK